MPCFVYDTSSLSAAKRSLKSLVGTGGYINVRGIKYNTTAPSYKSLKRLQRKRKSDLSVTFTNNVHPQELFIHFSWDFFDLDDKLKIIKEWPLFTLYAKLRYQASFLDKKQIKTIQKPLDHEKNSDLINMERATEVASLLLLCDFDVGKLIRVLHNKYTGDFLDFPEIDRVLNILSSIKPDKNQPTHDFNLLHHIYHQGVPQKASFECSRSDMLRRNLYDNHKQAHPHYNDIEPKIASDVQKSYALALPRWTLRFIDGLFLAAIGWVTRTKNGITKGRQVNDPSANLHCQDTGAVNDQINIKTDCPDTFYRDALQRILIRTYNNRISHPRRDIIKYKDDLVTAFKRVRYHPDISSAHAFVFSDFLIIPIGLVFGARDSPSWFCQVSELRAFASQHFSSLGLEIPDQTLIDLVTFDIDPSDPTPFTQAFPDKHNKGLPSLSPGPHNTFVDDTVMTELITLIRQAAIASVLTANLFIGDALLVEAPINPIKFERFFRYTNEVLGFIINTRKMTISYPPDKQSSLLQLLSDHIWSPNLSYPIRLLASILGKMRNLAQILPFGNHLSINLQLVLSRYIKTSLSSHPFGKHENIKSRLARAWNKSRRVHISKPACTDLTFLTNLLSMAPQAIWHRPISLLIPREAHFSSKSDASDLALGGFCLKDLPFQWRLPAEKLNARNLHINIKEFLALLITIYFKMISLKSLIESNNLPAHLSQLDGFIFESYTDNTSAISWMTHASRSREPIVVRLSHLLSRMIFSFNAHSPSLFQPTHIPGHQNVEADALSRPLLFPTYSDVFQSFPHLSNLPPLRIPSKLKSLLLGTISGSSTEEQTRLAMTTLFSPEKSSLLPISKDWASQTLL